MARATQAETLPPAVVKPPPTYKFVPETASATEIKTSYHRLLKQYHPDLHNHSGFPWVREQAEQMTKKIGQAYQVLANEDKRKDYDRELRRSRGGR